MFRDKHPTLNLDLICFSPNMEVACYYQISDYVRVYVISKPRIPHYNVCVKVQQIFLFNDGLLNIIFGLSVRIRIS